MIDAALLLNPAQVGVCQAVVFHGVLASGLQAVLCDGGAHLLALTGVRPILREALCRQRPDQDCDCDCDCAHFYRSHENETSKWRARTLTRLPAMLGNERSETW